MSATTVILPLGKSPSARMLVKHQNRAAWREPCDRELNTELAKSMLVPLRPAVLTRQDCTMELLPRHTTLPPIGTPRHPTGLKSCQQWQYMPPLSFLPASQEICRPSGTPAMNCNQQKHQSTCPVSHPLQAPVEFPVLESRIQVPAKAIPELRHCCPRKKLRGQQRRISTVISSSLNIDTVSYIASYHTGIVVIVEYVYLESVSRRSHYDITCSTTCCGSLEPFDICI